MNCDWSVNLISLIENKLQCKSQREEILMPESDFGAQNFCFHFLFVHFYKFYFETTWGAHNRLRHKQCFNFLLWVIWNEYVMTWLNRVNCKLRMSEWMNVNYLFIVWWRRSIIFELTSKNVEESSKKKC